jgi:outer membrane autotransporter protein
MSLRNAVSRCGRGGLSVAVAAGISASFVQLVGAQSLDAAVEEQLAFVFDDNFGDSCVLLNGDDPAVLVGELQNICTRGQPDGGPTSSSGGDSGTPASMPDAVRQRLDEASVEEGPVRGFFLTLSTGRADRSDGEFQGGYQGRVSGLLLGLDREFGDWVAGFAVESFTQDGDFLAGGDFETTSLGVTAFGTRALGNNAAIDFYAGQTGLSNERLRAARFVHLFDDGSPFREYEGLPAADFDATEWLAGAQYTYTIAHDNVTFGPKLAIDWSTTDFDAYQETETVASGLALTFYDDERTSLIATIGLDASIAISTDFGVVMLGEYLYWKHELDDDQRVVGVSFVGDTRNQRFQYQTEPPDEEYFEFGVNLIFLLQGGLQVFAAYEQTASHRFLDSDVMSVGFRKEF